jgi:hypothetical protein
MEEQNFLLSLVWVFSVSAAVALALRQYRLLMKFVAAGLVVPATLLSWVGLFYSLVPGAHLRDFIGVYAGVIGTAAIWVSFFCSPEIYGAVRGLAAALAIGILVGCAATLFLLAFLVVDAWRGDTLADLANPIVLVLLLPAFVAVHQIRSIWPHLRPGGAAAEGAAR